MNKNKPSRLRFGMFAVTLIVLSFLLIGTALYNTHILTQQAEINNQEIDKAFQRLSSNEDDSYRAQLQNILIGQATSQLSQYSKDITATATSNGNLLLLWASGITLFTIGFVFLGFAEFKYKMQDATHLLGKMEHMKSSVKSSLGKIDEYKDEIKEGLQQLDKDKDSISKVVTHVDDILSKVKALQIEVHEDSFISHFNLKMQGILNSNHAYTHKIEALSDILKELNSNKELKNSQWQELSEKCNGYLGQLSEINGDYKKSITYYDEVIRLSKKPIHAHLWRAHAYTELGQHRNAIIDFNQILQIDADNSKAYYLRGTTFLLLNEKEKAQSDLNRAILLAPEHAEAYNKRGLTYPLEDYDRAIADFDKAIRLNPALSEALVNKGMLYYMLENYKEALIYFIQAVDINLSNHWAREKRAECYVRLNQNEKALEDFSFLINNGTINSQIYLQRGKLLDGLEKYSEAISNYNESIRLAPTAEAYVARGMAFYIEGQYAEAMVDFERYLKLFPDGNQDAGLMMIIEEINQEIGSIIDDD